MKDELTLKEKLDIRDEFSDLGVERDNFLNLTLSKILFLIFVIALFGLYVGNLLFGVNSLGVLNNLENREKTLQIDIEKLKEENAKLQKEYFELKGLEPK